MRDYPQYEDLGLDPESDRTEDLRPEKVTPPGLQPQRRLNQLSPESR